MIKRIPNRVSMDDGFDVFICSKDDEKRQGLQNAMLKCQAAEVSRLLV